jgi:hypothetical protein
MKGYIRINNKTRGHREMLEAQGYEVEEVTRQVTNKKTGETKDATFYAVTVTDFVEGVVDLTTDEGKATVREAIAAKKAFTYRTEWLIPGQDRSHKGFYALSKLGRLSAMVMTPEQAEKVNKSAVSAEMNNILDELF